MWQNKIYKTDNLSSYATEFSQHGVIEFILGMALFQQVTVFIITIRFIKITRSEPVDP